jgi:hypothetical protein
MQTYRTDAEDGTETATTADDRPRETHDASEERVTSIAKDDAFHLLQNARRRAVLRYLLEHEDIERFVMRDVAEVVAAWEHDTTVQQLVSDERQRVYIALYQSHLPKLDEHGLIEYNQSRGVIEPKPLIAAVEPYLADGLHADDDLVAVPDEPRVDAHESSNGGLGTVVSSLLGN